MSSIEFKKPMPRVSEGITFRNRAESNIELKAPILIRLSNGSDEAQAEIEAARAEVARLNELGEAAGKIGDGDMVLAVVSRLLALFSVFGAALFFW